MERKPKIGVLPLYDTKQASKWNSIWIFPGYLNGILEVSGMPFLLPLLKNEADIRALVNEFDGFLFTGGQDVDPALYNQEMTEYCNEVSPERDYMEVILFDEVRKQDKALFGVCRGLQFFNVALGGTLYQDLIAQKRIQILYSIPRKQSLFFRCTILRLKKAVSCLKLSVKKQFVSTVCTTRESRSFPQNWRRQRAQRMDWWKLLRYQI